MSLVFSDFSSVQGEQQFDPFEAAGIVGVISKATQGTTGVDHEFRRNFKESARTKRRRTAYHWLEPLQDPVVQAGHFVDVLGNEGYDVAVDIDPVVDFESAKAKGMPPQVVLDHLVAFGTAVETSALRRRIMIYTGKWYWREFVGDLDSPWAAQRHLWHAQYPSTNRVGTYYDAALRALPSPDLPLPWASRGLHETFWQFDGDKGLVLPSGTDADFDRFNGTLDDLDAMIADGKIGPPQPILLPDTGWHPADRDEVLAQLIPG